MKQFITHMHFKIDMLLLAVCLCVTTVSAQAQNDHAAFATSIFYSICVSNRGNPDRVSGYAEFNLVPLIPAARHHFLEGKSGKAWSAKVTSGQFVLTISDEGKCSVHVRRISTKEILAKFALLIKHIEKKGNVAELPKEEKTFSFGTVSTRYFMSYPNSKEAIFLLDIATSDALEAPSQAVMSIEAKPWSF